jgi:formylglycine-generating enzyme required for sulfatase activity
MEAVLQAALSRLEQLPNEFRELREGVHKAVLVADMDPEMALTRSRKVLEYVIRDVYQRRCQKPPGSQPLENLLQQVCRDGHFPPVLEAYANTVRMLGNVGTHRFDQTITLADVHQSLTQLMPILQWYIDIERPGGAAPQAGRSPEPPTGKTTFTKSPVSSQAQTRIAVVPKGLRSFDANDTDFFLDLLPGPRDKDGLPESIRFWKHRIEENYETAFMIGVIYGPSGCGKTSLIKAGLLPRLAQRVVSVYVEATAEETETQLLNGLRKRCANLPVGLDLTETIAALCQEKPGNKVLLVIDQFEQWLHANRGKYDTNLAQALRQCDGEHVQCLLLIRDDFWLALNRFMEELRIELVQEKNMALVDLFDPIHARNVLAAFGRAFGRLTETPSADQVMFLDQAIADLSQDGRIISIQLALFADMMKGKPWVPVTLKALGGSQGVGVTFLEETFASHVASPRNRLHQEAARAVLSALLPEQGTNIKGNMRSHNELMAASGYASRPDKFAELLRILETEIRLISPTDLEGRRANGAPAVPVDEKYYELTHDYLVPSLREWLTRKQKETRRGRAQLLLADRSAVWNARPEARQLPSFAQWVKIQVLTRKRSWTAPQQKMMRKASQHHLLGGLALFALLVVFAVTGLGIRSHVEQQNKTEHAVGLVNRLLDANIAEVPAIIKEINDYRPWADPLLRDSFAMAETAGRSAKTEADKIKHASRQLHASLALLPIDPVEVKYLYGRLLSAEPPQVAVVRDSLFDYRDALVDGKSLTTRLWEIVENPEKSHESQRLRAACALAAYDPEDAHWEKASGQVVEQMVAVNPLMLSFWINGFRPVKDKLLIQFVAVFRDRNETRATERMLATSILADYFFDKPALLTELLMDADEKQFQVLYAKLEDRQEQSIPHLASELDKQVVTQTVPILKVNGTLTREEPSAKITGVKDVDLLPAKSYAVKMKEHKAYTITMTSAEVDPALVLYEQKGKQLAYQPPPIGRRFGPEPKGNAPRARWAQLTFLPLKCGEYTVCAASYRGSGDFVLEIVEVDTGEEAKEQLAKRQANAAVALLRMGQTGKLWPLLKRSNDPRVPDDPRLRTYVIHRLGSLGADVAALVPQLDEGTHVTIRRAVVLSLGGFGGDAWPPGEQDLLVTKMQELYRTAEDPGLHGATEWLLRQWKQGEWVRKTNEEWAKNLRLERIKQSLKEKDGGKPQWYVNSLGQTMVVIPGPVEFLMGSPPAMKGKSVDEDQHRCRIKRTFALAAKPVTVKEYREANPNYEPPEGYAPTTDCPVVSTSWYQAAAYCNWLSKKEGIAEEQWCYATDEKGEVTQLKEGYLRLTGYRLPTEAEWEYACRAGVATSRYYGESKELLGTYAWFLDNSSNQGWPVAGKIPNDFGLFDMHGNVWNWCQDRYKSYPEDTGENAIDDVEDRLLAIKREDARVLRGGSFTLVAGLVRSAYRSWADPTYHYSNTGIRLARTICAE